MTAVALLLCYAGMAGFSLAMRRHHDQVWPRRRRPGWEAPALRWLGALLLALALELCIRAWNYGVGIVIWLGLLSAGALPLALLLAYRPRPAALLASALLALSVPAAIWQLGLN